MNNDAGLFSTFYLDGSTVTLNADYSRRDLYLYGMDPDLFLPNTRTKDDNDKRAFNLINGNVLWKSDKDAGEVFYSLGASYQFFNARDKYYNGASSQTMKEHAFAVSGLFGADLNDETQTISIAARAAMYKRNNLLDTLGNNILLSAQPSWTYNDDYFSVKLGFQYLLDNYNSTTKHRIYPAVSASYKLHEYFTPMIEVKGETEVNNFRKLALENNYISFGNYYNNYPEFYYRNPDFQNTNYKLIGVFSIKGDIDAFSYNVFASYSKIDHLPLFANRAYEAGFWGLPLIYDYNEFRILYAKGEKISFGGEISYNDDIFSIYAKAVYNKYSLSSESPFDVIKHALHKPAFEGLLNFRYKVADNLILTADARALLQRYALENMNPFERKLKNVIDLGVGAEVLITNNFSTFVNFSNLLNQKYETYSRYAVPGFIVSAGVTYRF
jgi:hypothetical protein